MWVKSFFILFLSCLTPYVLSNPIQKKDSTTIRLQRVEGQIKDLSDFIKNKNQDTLVIEHLDELAQSLKHETNWLMGVLPSLMALFVVFISTLGAMKVANRNNTTQLRIAKDQLESREKSDIEQLRSHESTAADQLQVSRQQIEETSKMTLAQVRANKILQARLTWIESLRDNLSSFIGEVAVIQLYVEELKKKKDQNTSYIELLKKIHQARIYDTRISLFLDTVKNPLHKDLEELKAQYLKTLSSIVDNEGVKTVEVKKEEINRLNSISKRIIILGKDIIVEAWSQAIKESSEK